LAAGGATGMITGVLHWLTDPTNWHGQAGVPAYLAQHAEYSLIALLIATCIALPLGLLIGHTGRGTFVIVFIVNAFRALPTIGLLVLFVVLISPHIHGRSDAAYLIPTEIALVLLAIPPILSNTYAGVQSVEENVRDAAKGMGMNGWRSTATVELPCALPLIIAGFRSATLQVIATATISAYVSLGGLGRYVFDGLAEHDYSQMAAGALLVALLAVFADLVLIAAQRWVVSRGISGRYDRSATDADSVALTNA
jgi:osmoprotectant transport system permease protein